MASPHNGRFCIFLCQIFFCLVFFQCATSLQYPLKYFLRGLKPETSTATIRQHFSKFGKIAECKGLKDVDPGQSPYVIFEDPEDVKNMLVSHGGYHTIDGAKVLLKSDLSTVAAGSNQGEGTAKLDVSNTGQVNYPGFLPLSGDPARVSMAHGSLQSQLDELNAPLTRSSLGSFGSESGSNPSSSASSPDLSVLVTGLQSSDTNKDLETAFGQFGEVAMVVRSKNAFDGTPERFAMLFFTSESDRKKAVDAASITINGHKVMISENGGTQKAKTQGNSWGSGGTAGSGSF